MSYRHRFLPKPATHPRRPAPPPPGSPRAAQTVLLALVLLAAALLTSCNPDPTAAFVFAEIDPPPAGALDLLTFVLPGRFDGFTWRVYVRVGDLEWVAATAQGPRAELFEIGIRRTLPGGEETYSWSGAYGFSPGSCFGWKRAAPGQLPGATPGGPSKHQLRAIGYAFDPRVAKIVGVTTEGARVEAVPVNGFWFLEVSTQKPYAPWRSITARNRWGLNVHSYRLDGMPEEEDPCPT